MGKTILENVWMLLPRRRIAHGDMELSGGRISALRETPAHGEPARLVMPGFVNCHGHTAMTLLRGTGAGLPLQRWLNEAIFPREAKLTDDAVSAGACWGALEMLACGTTCVADMYEFTHVGEAAMAATGIKCNTCFVGLDFPGASAGRLADCVAFAQEKPANSRVRRDLCVHSEYLTTDQFCRELAAANRELRRKVHFHASETRREHEECISRHGRTPIAQLAATGLLDFGGYAAHCVWCSDDDFRIMAEHGVTLVHNPTSNLKLGSGVARIVRARELGVNVALGTDGCASNDNLNMFEEMHLAALLPKGIAQDPSLVSSWDVIEMATICGARALGRDDETGELAVGKAADLCVADLTRPHLAPARDLADLVVYSMQASDIVQTYVAGELCYDHGAWPRVDAPKAKDALRKYAASLD